jgi:transposase
MNAPEHLSLLSRDALLALVAEQQRHMAEQQRQMTELTARLEVLQAEVERLTRGTKRQAAPFSKGSRVAEPKPSGRKPGAGSFHYREVPLPEAIPEPSVDVQVMLDACPACGGRLEEARVDFAYTTELPATPRPKVTQYRVWVCRCTTCGTEVRGQYPDVTLDQFGATAHRLGPRVMAAAHALHYGVGLPVRKVPAVVHTLTGVQLTQSALTQDARRRVEGPVGTAYEQLRAAVPEAPVAYTDDTGWRVGGEPAHLMVFETDTAIVYQIRPRHLRSLSDVVERKTGRAREFGTRLKTVLQDALALWHEYRDGQVTDFKLEAEALQAELTYQLRDRRLKDRDNQRLLNELGWHHDRGHVLRFLVDPRLEPTNHRAEQALRPAVIARKVSHGCKNGAGAHAFAPFTSVVRTLATQRVDSLVENLYQLFRGLDVQATPL